MPGIFGLVSPASKPKKELTHDLEAMRQSLMHLPSYKSHTFVGDRVALGRIGPSVLNPEKQPVFNEDGSRMAVFEGELFDPSALHHRLKRTGHVLQSRCDAEIALHAFEEFGAAGIAELAGAYIGGLFDSTTGACHLFTDRLGLRGCYYCLAADGTFVFASEMKAIATVLRSNTHADIQAISAFLNCGFPFFERTFFEDVKFIPYGSVVSFVNGRVTVERYWDLPRLAPPADWKFEDAVQEGAGHMARAVGRQLRQGGRMGAFLSGGLDSRAIVASALAHGHRLPTFTLGAGHNTELALAVRAARRMGVPHESLPIHPDFLIHAGKMGDWYTDGMLPCTQLPWLSQLPYIASRVESLFSGYLGGVLLGGVFLRSGHLSNPPTETQGQLIAEQVAGQFSPFLQIGLTPTFCREAQDSFHEAKRQIAQRTGDRGFAMELDRAYLATDERRATHITNGTLVNFFLDVKYPFGDYDLLDFYASLPARWRLGSRLYRAMLCLAFPQLTDVPCISANTQFVATTLDSEPGPWHIKWRKVMQLSRFLAGRLSGGRVSLPDRNTYLHYGHWYRTVPALRQWIQDILLDDRTLSRGYYDREGIKRLLHVQMTRGYAFSTIAAMVTFEHWNRFFIDKQPPSQTGGVPLSANAG